jgi:hypothetical protein
MGVATADDVTGKDSLICTAWSAVACSTEGTCEDSEAWRLNMPDFVKVDLRERQLSTPEGTDQPRFTEIEGIWRNAGQLFLNGSQEDRGFTWVINEGTGEGTIAIVTDTTAIVLFTACAATDNLR